MKTGARGQQAAATPGHKQGCECATCAVVRQRLRIHVAYRQGWSVEALAKAAETTVEQVEFILGL